MSEANARFATVAKWSAVPVGLLLSVGLVWQSSYSAFSATTSNPTNNWTAGTVVLADDDSNTAMFTATGLKPGSTGAKCIVVTSSGTLASTVKLYGTSPATTLALSTYINLVVEQGTGGTFAGGCGGFVQDVGAPNIYTGTLAGLGTTYTNFATGFGSWAPAAGTLTKVYRITYTVDAATPNTSQGGTAAIGLTWEAQNS
jgi:hypothetical protein